MKKIIASSIAISIFSVATLANGQETKSKTQINQQKTKVSEWSPESDSFKNADSIPKNYNGSNIKKITNWLIKNAPKEKGEFEKQSEYELKISKVEDLIKENLYAFNLSDNQGFSNKLTYKYDADKEAYVPSEYSYISFISSENKEYIIHNENNKLNSFKYREYKYGIYIRKQDITNSKFFTEGSIGFNLNAILPYPIEKSRKIYANDIGVLAVGNIGVKNIKIKTTCDTPTISTFHYGCGYETYIPFFIKNFYIYHKPTGEILASDRE